MPKRPKSAIDQLKAWAMRRLTRILWISGVVTGLSAGVVGAAKAWPIIEPWWYADRNYVRFYSSPRADHIKIIEIQLRYNEKERSGLISEAGKLELDLQSPATQATPQYRALVQQRIDQIKRELEIINNENKNLRDEKTQ